MILRVGFSKPKDKWFPIFSWIIRLWYGIPYSHTYIRWYSERIGEWIAYEAKGTTVNFKSNEVFEKTTDIQKEYFIDIDARSGFSIVKWCIQNAGKPYGMWQLLGLMLHEAFGFKRNLLAMGEKDLICTELVARVMENFLGIVIKYDKELLDPKQLYYFIQNDNKFKEIK